MGPAILKNKINGFVWISAVTILIFVLAQPLSLHTFRGLHSFSLSSKADDLQIASTEKCSGLILTILQFK